MERLPVQPEQNHVEKPKKGSKLRKAIGVGLIAGAAAIGGAQYEKSMVERQEAAKKAEETKAQGAKLAEREKIEKLTIEKIKKAFFGEDLKFFGKDFNPAVGEEVTKSEGTKETGNYKTYTYKEDEHGASYEKELGKKEPNEDYPSHEYEKNFFDKDHVVFGDIDGDGVEDAVFVSWENGGGSGFFYSLNVVVNRNGVPEKVATVGLGDRSIIKSVKIDSGKILVDYIGHGEGDSMVEPTEEERQVFMLTHANGKYTLFEQVSPE